MKNKKFSEPIDTRLMYRMLGAAEREEVVESKKAIEDMVMRKKDLGRRADSKHQNSL